ncbi:hypothetical protein [Carnimonas bestiolae]|uniref:hypothetical protein n=1 Tax=Carnimonas bestiolae TaxID=3402172 RepID=UPI003EDC0E72
MKELNTVEVSAVAGGIGGHAAGLFDSLEGAAVLATEGATFGGLVAGSHAGTNGAGGLLGAGILAQGVGAIAGIVAGGITGAVIGFIQGYDNPKTEELSDGIFSSIENGRF